MSCGAGWRLGAGGVRRILAIRRHALGDVLVTLPALQELGTAFPRATIDLVVDPPFAALLSGLDPCVRVVPWPTARAGAGGGWLRELRAAGYDLAIDWLGSPRTAFWTAISGAPTRIGYDLRWRAWAYNVRVSRNRACGTALAQYAGEAFLDPVRALGVAARAWRPATLRPAGAMSAAHRTWTRAVRGWPRPLVGLVLSASWSAKAWPVEQAAQLCALARADGASVLFVPGPGEDGLAQRLRNASPETPHAPSTTLPELADLLGLLDVLVATDCGPRHLAACLGVPTVTLFGPTDPRGWNQAHPDRVAARTGEPCSPCDLVTCPVPGHPCMTRLTGALAWEKVQALLARRGVLRDRPGRGEGEEES